jgi:hypothetical protein
VGCRPSVPGDCPNANQYCKVTNCAASGGTCTTKPPISDGAKPACGCDNVSYWNESLAGHNGVNVTSSGASCPKLTAVSCNSINVSCSGGHYCNLGVATSQQCSASVTGTCWALPSNCPVIAGQYSVCGGSSNADCFNACNVIKDEVPFYFDSRCP